MGDPLDPISIAYSLEACLSDTLFDDSLFEAKIEAASAPQRADLDQLWSRHWDAYFDIKSTLNTINLLKESSLFVRQGAEIACKTWHLQKSNIREERLIS